jgi:hypothetical protein
MSSKPITELIDRWRPRRALAEEIGASVEQVHKWAQFGRIPVEWHIAVIEAAARKGVQGIDADWMLRAHNRDRGAA